MPAYFASDVHLRPDRPDRAGRFAAFVAGLAAADHLVVVGDLCDFWFASRRGPDDARRCPGLAALRSFRRIGGRLTILPGNHDAWLGPFYAEDLEAEVVTARALDGMYHGQRVHAEHGHRLGARSRWKAPLESRAFLEGFRNLPGPIASGLDRLLDRSNDATRTDVEHRHLNVYRAAATRQAGTADLVVFGHVHTPLDEALLRPRLVVLGSWKSGGSYLRIDDGGAELRSVAPI